jgi:hypothetical protein
VDVRRQLLIRETIYSEGSLPALVPVTRVAACAIVRNPLAGRLQDDLSDLVPFGEKLGEQLTKEAVAALPGPAVSYGKAAIIGLDGDIEHGAAIIPSNVKVAAAGTAIDVPLSERNDPWLFDNIDTMTVSVPDAPRPAEIVVIVVLSDGGRPRPRIDKNGAKAV